MLVLHEVFETALVDLKAGRFARAAGGLCQILALWPDHADSWYHLGEVREAAGDRVEAILCYQKAVNKIAGGHPSAQQAIARWVDNEVLQAFDLEAEGRSEEAAARWGTLTLLEADASEAADQLLRVARARVGEAEAGQPAPPHLANFRIWTARDGLRRLQAAEAANDLAGAATECHRLLALKPDLPALLEQLRQRAAAYVDRAIADWLAKGKVRQAAGLLARAMVHHADEPKLVARRRQVVERLLEAGREWQRDDKVARAAWAFRQAERLDPDAEAPRLHLSGLQSDAEARSRALVEEAKAQEAKGDQDAAAAAYYRAGAASLDPAGVYAQLLETRFRPLSSASGRLLMPGVGAVDFRNASDCTRLQPAGGARGTVLVAFHREPALFDDTWEHFQVTSINWESREICRLFLRMGYAVDVVGFAGGPPAEGRVDYAAVFSASSFLARNHAALPASARRIVLMTTSNPDYQNRMELEAVADLGRRRGGGYAPKRQVPDAAAQLESLERADHGILIGNAVTLETYPERLRAKLRPIRVTASQVDWIKDPTSYVPESREFLWYFGHGAVLKGLDRLLEVFSRQDRWTLNVVGHVAYEPDFDQMYFRELYGHPRIRMLGHLRGDSPALAEACRRSFCVIAPSASEGMSNAVATCLQVGLFPILSRPSGIDLPEGCGLYLDDMSEAAITAAAERAHAMPAEELARQIAIIQKHALDAYSRESYARTMGALLQEMMDAPLPARAP